MLSILATTADGELAARAFERACEIRRGLTIGPGQDMAKWNLFRQLKDLLEAIAPKIFLEGLSPKLEKEPEETELDVLTDVLAKIQSDHHRHANSPAGRRAAEITRLPEARGGAGCGPERACARACGRISPFCWRRWEDRATFPTFAG